MANTAECGHCGNSEPYNIKTDGAKFARAQRRSKTLGTYGDPVADEIKSLTAVGMNYQGFSVIPFLDGGDATLHFLRKMRELSPTQGACHNNIKDYVMGGQFYATPRKEPGFSHPEEFDVAASVADHNYLIDFIKNLNPEMTGQKFVETGESIFDNYKGNGQGWLKVEFITVADVRHVYFENIDAEKGKYMNPNEYDSLTGSNTLLISSSGFTNTPDEQLELIDEYPAQTDYGNGRIATVIPYKRKAPGRDWYGLPDHLASLYFQFLEVQNGEYITEGYANRWTGKVFFETVMDDESEDDGDNFVSEIEYLFTNKGEGRRFLLRNRLVSDEATSVHEFKDESTHESHSSYANIAERQIIKSNNWSSILMSIPQPGKLGNSQEFTDIFKIKYSTVIKPLQKKVCDVLNTALFLAAEFKGDKKAASLSVMLNNLFADLLKTETENGEKKSNEKSDD